MSFSPFSRNSICSGPMSLLPTAKTLFIPMSEASLLILWAVSRLGREGSTTMIRALPPFTVALPRCSTPASMSTTATSSLWRMRWLRRFFRNTFSGQAQPPPPFWTAPRISSFTPSLSTQNFSGMSATEGLSLKNTPYPSEVTPVRSFISSLISHTGTRSGGTLIPRDKARLGLGSASTASTLFGGCPSPPRARSHAIVAARVVFPAPPLPDIATFKIPPSAPQQIGYKGRPRWDHNLSSRILPLTIRDRPSGLSILESDRAKALSLYLPSSPLPRHNNIQCPRHHLKPGGQGAAQVAVQLI